MTIPRTRKNTRRLSSCADALNVCMRILSPRTGRIPSPSSEMQADLESSPPLRILRPGEWRVSLNSRMIRIILNTHRRRRHAHIYELLVKIRTCRWIQRNSTRNGKDLAGMKRNAIDARLRGSSNVVHDISCTTAFAHASHTNTNLLCWLIHTRTRTTIKVT